MRELRIHGRGGQGAVIASKVLAVALFREVLANRLEIVEPDQGQRGASSGFPKLADTRGGGRAEAFLVERSSLDIAA